MKINEKERKSEKEKLEVFQLEFNEVKRDPLFNVLFSFSCTPLWFCLTRKNLRFKI